MNVTPASSLSQTMAAFDPTSGFDLQGLLQAARTVASRAIGGAGALLSQLQQQCDKYSGLTSLDASLASLPTSADGKLVFLGDFPSGQTPLSGGSLASSSVLDQAAALGLSVPSQQYDHATTTVQTSGSPDQVSDGWISASDLNSAEHSGAYTVTNTPGAATVTLVQTSGSTTTTTQVQLNTGGVAATSADMDKLRADIATRKGSELKQIDSLVKSLDAALGPALQQQQFGSEQYGTMMQTVRQFEAARAGKEADRG